jgi:hypothetical protein
MERSLVDSFFYRIVGIVCACVNRIEFGFARVRLGLLYYACSHRQGIFLLSTSTPFRSSFLSSTLALNHFAHPAFSRSTSPLSQQFDLSHVTNHAAQLNLGKLDFLQKLHVSYNWEHGGVPERSRMIGEVKEVLEKRYPDK